MGTKIEKIEGDYTIQGNSLTNGDSILFIKRRSPELITQKKSPLYLFLKGSGYISSMYAGGFHQWVTDYSHGIFNYFEGATGQHSFTIDYRGHPYSVHMDFDTNTAQIVKL